MQLRKRDGMQTIYELNSKKISQAIIHITYACSHECPMCYANAGKDNEQPEIHKLYGIIDKLVENDIRDITLVGGDPAEYPGIVPLANYCSRKDATVSILSNTLSFGGRREDVLNSISVYEGTIHHSLSHMHDMFCHHEGAFDLLVENLKFFSDHQKSIGLAINMIPYNYDVIYDIVKTVINRGVCLDHVIMQRIIPFGRAEGKNDFLLNKSMIGDILGQADQIEKDFSAKIIFEDPIPACNMDKKYIRFAHPCEWGYTKVSLDFEGNITRCGADVFHPIGNIFRDDINQIWKSNPSILEFREKRFLREKCKACNYFGVCGGGCPVSVNNGIKYSTDYMAQ